MEYPKREFVFHFFKAIFNTSCRPLWSLSGKWNWSAQTVEAIPERNLPVLNFANHSVPKPWTDRLACVQPPLYTGYWPVCPSKCKTSSDVSAVVAGPRLLNMQNLNLAWIKRPVARVIIPSHGEGKHIAQDLLKVACYIIICMQLCTIVQKPHETGDANECSGAGQKTVEESLTNSTSNGRFSCYLETVYKLSEAPKNSLPVTIHGVPSKLQNGRSVSIIWRKAAFSLTGAHFWVENPQGEIHGWLTLHQPHQPLACENNPTLLPFTKKGKGRERKTPSTCIC